MRLFQERLRAQPFWMLAACIAVNRASWRVGHGVVNELRERWPTPKILASADASEVAAVAWPIGLQSVRASRWIALAQAWNFQKPTTAEDVRRLPGCGRYAADSWVIFVEGRRDVDPSDHYLRGYLEKTQ